MMRPAARIGLLVLMMCAFGAHGAVTVEQARKLLLSGRYDECIKAAAEGVQDREWDDDWPLLLAESQLIVGRYAEAAATMSQASLRHRSSIRVRLLAYDALRQSGQTELAADQLDEIAGLAGSRNYTVRDAESLVALGKAALLFGADPRKVLEQFFDRARQASPELREAWLAGGQLALHKGDYALASKSFSDALAKFPEDPEMHYGLARAFLPGDRSRMLKAIDGVFEVNTNHVGCHLLLAEHLVDAESYQGARHALDLALAINPWHPEAWALRAVVDTLEGKSAEAAQSRENALKFWKTNPLVDHTMGRKLSQKYRFVQGATMQRQALAWDKNYLPAKIQLAQDLLRLGDEDEGWALAREVNQRDGYDVTAYNLVTLKDVMAGFTTLTNEHFVLRMGAAEAPVYGREALALLEEARTTLCAKYGLTLERPTVVEIFPEQKDFGVRTFGMPENPGYLGVCFGPVITANSPVSASKPANWHAVLWHEFCHVVTLGLSKNKMPRWLSEGISVYEETQRNPSWGQRMTPAYREMLSGPAFVPLSKLSSAFMAPRSDLHLQFAYFESYLAVRFLMEQFGLDSIKLVLRDLGNDVEVNKALTARTKPVKDLDIAFAEFARQQANSLAPALTWDTPEGRGSGAKLESWLLLHPRSFHGQLAYAQWLLGEKRIPEAERILTRLLWLYPGYLGVDNPMKLLAEASRRAGQTNQEREWLSRWAALDADAVEAFLRLADVAMRSGDWREVSLNARRFIAVNPLVAQPYRQWGLAAEALGKSEEATKAWESLLPLNPPDPAEVHYRLGRLLHNQKNPDAKKHVLMALEEAPRYRDAHRLLLELNAGKPPAPAPSPAKP